MEELQKPEFLPVEAGCHEFILILSKCGEKCILFLRMVKPQNARIEGVNNSSKENLEDKTTRSIEALLYKFYNYLTSEIKHLPRNESFLHRLADSASKGIEEVDDSKVSMINDLEWENLVILDACRYDLYKEVKGGNPDFRYSSGSGTGWYIEENFSNTDFQDTVYITNNPNFSEKRFKKHCGRDKDNVFHTVFTTYEDGFDPTYVLEDLRTAEKLFPDKRKVVHLMPPHIPIQTDHEYSELGGGLWRKAELGLIDKEKIWESYKENLSYGLSFVDDILDVVDGRTVLTSDHGNLFGENGMYGHHSPRPVKPLRKVPVEVLKP